MAVGYRPSGTGRRDRSRRDLSAPWRHIDGILLVTTVALGIFGVAMVFSATRGADDAIDTSFVVRQGAFMVVGVGAALGISLVDYHRLRDWAPLLYLGSLGLLVAVLSPLGSEVNGAQAWFLFGPIGLQPAELAKLALIVTLSSMLAAWGGEIDLRRLALALGVAGVPIGLIMLQPDLGTVLVFVVVTLALLLVGGVRGRHVLVLSIIGIVGVVGVLNSDALAEYQKERLTVFADPEADVQGAAYNLQQSITAVANGGLTGQGYGEGSQTQLRFVPEQQTDFIFTVVGEELGFAGAATLLGLYAVLAWRIWRAAQLSRDLLGTLLCVGVLAMFGFQMFQSVGMSTGIMPVTGIPLPFISYGGSSVITSFLAVGIVLNVHMRRFR
jgi:rod shape determining protein RodA